MNLKEVNYERIITYLLIIVVAVVPLLYFPYLNKAELYKTGEKSFTLIEYDNIYKPKITAVYYLVLILSLIILLKQFYNNDKIKTDITNLSISLFFILTILSTFFSDYYYQSLYGRPFRWEGLITYISYVIIFIGAAYFVKELINIKKIIKYLMVSGVILSIYGLIQYFGYDFIMRDPLRIKWSRAFSTFGNPNFAASYIVIILSISLVLYIFSEKINNLYKYGFYSSIFFAFLISTNTRSALVGLLISLIIFVIYFYKYIAKNFKKVLILILIFIIIFSIIDYSHDLLYSRRILSLFMDIKTISVSNQDSEIERTGSGRFFIYKYSIPLLIEQPILGSGPDTFDKSFPQHKFNNMVNRDQKYIVDKAHNEYLQIGVTLGLPALFFYLLFLLTIFKKGFKALKSFKKNIDKINKYHAALFFAVISYTVTALFNISVVSVAPIFWVVLGLNITLSQLEE